MELLLYRLSEGGRTRENYFIEPDRSLLIALPRNGYRGSQGIRELSLEGLKVSMRYRREVLDGFTYIRASISLDPPPERLIEVTRDGNEVKARLINSDGSTKELKVVRVEGEVRRTYVVVDGVEIGLTGRSPRRSAHRKSMKSRAEEVPPTHSSVDSTVDVVVIIRNDLVKVKTWSEKAVPSLRLAGFTYIDGEWILLKPEGIRYWSPWPHVNQLLYLLEKNGQRARVLEIGRK